MTPGQLSLRCKSQEKKRFIWTPADEQAYLLKTDKTSHEKNWQDCPRPYLPTDGARSGASVAVGYGMLGRSCVVHDSIGAVVPPGAEVEPPACVLDGCEERRDVPSLSPLCTKHHQLMLSVEQGFPRQNAPNPAAPKQDAPALLAAKVSPGPRPPLAQAVPLPLHPINSGHNFVLTQSGFAWRRPAT